MKKIKSLWQNFENKVSKIPQLVIVSGFLVLILRLPSLFEPCWYGDEGIYLTLGQEIRQGQMLYRDVHDNKPPLLYLLAAAAGNVFWFRFILLLWMLVTMLLFFRLVEQIFPKNKRTQGLLIFAFVILTSIPAFEGNIANAEIFFIGLIIAGFWAFLKKKHFWAGFLLGLSFLFKSPPLFDFGSLLVFSLIKAFSEKKLKDSFKRVILPMCGGFLLPFLATILYYSSQGALFYYIKSAFLLNFPYLSSWEGGGGGILSSGLFQRGLILFAFLSLVFWQRKKLFYRSTALLASLWLSFALFGALLSGRPYPHYLLQAVAPLLILLAAIGLDFSLFLKKKILLLLFLPVFLVPIAFFAYRFYTYPTLNYYKNFVQFVLKRKTKSDYCSWFDSRVNRNYRLAEFIRASVPEKERIFIWGNEPCVYALSRRLPAGRYTVAYHIIDFDGYKETMAAIRKQPPRLIILVPFDKSFPELYTFLKSRYLLINEDEGTTIWYRRSSD